MASSVSRLGRLSGRLARAGRGSAASSAIWFVVICAAGAGAAFGLKELEKQVHQNRQVEPVRKIRVKLTGWPDWLPQSLMQDFAVGLVPEGMTFENEALAREVFERASANPWISVVEKVQKDRLPDDPRTGVVEVIATYRKPFAMAGSDGQYCFVDRLGYRLPDAQVPRWQAVSPGANPQTAFFLDKQDVPAGWKAARIHYIIIDGVQAGMPAEGKQWQGDDLAAGAKLVDLMLTRPYCNQITVVDVRNHNSRVNAREPELKMYAQVGSENPTTEIRFGRFPRVPGDYEIDPRRKLSYLDQYVEEHKGVLAGLNRYLDLRYDNLIVSID